MSVMIPEEYGGMGLGLREAAVLMQEVAASGAGLTGGSALHFYIFPPQPIIRHGSARMKAGDLPAGGGRGQVVGLHVLGTGGGNDNPPPFSPGRGGERPLGEIGRKRLCTHRPKRP